MAKSAFVRIPLSSTTGTITSNAGKLVKKEENKDEGPLTPPSLKMTLKHKDVIPTHWWDGTPIKELYSNSECSHIPPLWLEWEWPPGCCPYYRTQYKSRAKIFCHHHGSLYKAIYEEAQNKLEWPLKSSGDSSKTTLRDGNVFQRYPILHHLLRAFFDTFIALSQRQKQGRMQCTIVFRTMGSDLQQLAEAITLLAKGRHPHYPNFEDESMIFPPDHLVEGKWVEVREGCYDYQLWKDKECIANGDEEVLQYICSHRVCGIRDDYQFWKKNECQPWAGKPVWILSDRRQHHILLDDNIHNLLDDSIASVRRQSSSNGSFQTLSSEEIIQQQGIHLIRVPTIAPVLDPQWFLRVIDQAQRRFASGA